MLPCYLEKNTFTLIDLLTSAFSPKGLITTSGTRCPDIWDNYWKCEENFVPLHCDKWRTKSEKWRVQVTLSNQRPRAEMLTLTPNLSTLTSNLFTPMQLPCNSLVSPIFARRAKDGTGEEQRDKNHTITNNFPPKIQARAKGIKHPSLWEGLVRLSLGRLG